MKLKLNLYVVAILNIPEGTVKSRINTAKLQLKSFMKKVDMNDKQLEQVLYDLGKEEIRPSKKLIHQTKTAIHSRALHFLVWASMLLNALTIVGFILLIKNYPILKFLIQGGSCIQT